MHNPIKELAFPEKVMLCLVLFLVGIFVWNSLTNGTIENANITDILKTISDIFSAKGE